MRPTPRDWLLLAGLGLVWGAAFMATKVATEDFPPLTLAGARLGLGALTLLAVLRLRGDWLPGFARPEERGFWRSAVAVAFLSNAMPFTLLSWGQRHIDSSLAGILTATVPLFVLPLAHRFVPGERMTRRRLSGVALGFAGVIVLAGPAAAAALAGGGALVPLAGGGALAPLAIGACLVSAFGYAAGSIVAKRAPQLGLIRFATAALAIATAMVLPLALVLEAPLAIRPSAAGAAALVYLGLVPTALATVMLLAVIGSAGPAFLSNVNYQIPVWAVALGALVLGETPSPRLGLALCLVLAGLAVAQNIVGIRRGGHARG